MEVEVEVGAIVGGDVTGDLGSSVLVLDLE